eukprot:m.76167 g.76167  ORF g.76167 m.76167 type:complete len:122 (-) comp14013_c3_seq1:982-1347(-)
MATKGTANPINAVVLALVLNEKDLSFLFEKTKHKSFVVVVVLAYELWDVYFFLLFLVTLSKGVYLFFSFLVDCNPFYHNRQKMIDLILGDDDGGFFFELIIIVYDIYAFAYSRFDFFLFFC